MFAHGYFGEGFFAGRYFPPVRLRGDHLCCLACQQWHRIERRVRSALEEATFDVFGDVLERGVVEVDVVDILWPRAERTNERAGTVECAERREGITGAPGADHDPHPGDVGEWPYDVLGDAGHVVASGFVERVEQNRGAPSTCRHQLDEPRWVDRWLRRQGKGVDESGVDVVERDALRVDDEIERVGFGDGSLRG